MGGQGVIYIVLVTLMGHVAPCPTDCRCSTGSGHVLNVLCASANLGAIPRDVPSGAQMLDLSRNRLTNVVSGSFPYRLERLLELYLEDNTIQSIEPGSFNMTQNLTSLHLARNRITRLENGVFDGLSALRTLDISRNRITNLSRTIFRDLDAVTLLYLEENKINYIENGTLQHLSQLAYLRLQNNNLTTLKEGLFHGLSKLKEVYLSGNSITSVHPRTFYNNPLLGKLDVTDNILQSIPSLPNVTSIKTLILDNNLISSLTPGPGLEDHSLLETLSLRGNRITYIDYKIFHILPNLKELFCSGNQLTWLDPRIGEYINSTERVDFAGNPWLCDYRLYWVSLWSYRKEIFGTCSLPEKYARRTLTSLEEEDFYVAPIQSCLPSTYTFNGEEPLSVFCPVFAFPSPRIAWSLDGNGPILPSHDNGFHIRDTRGKLVNSSLYFDLPSESIEGVFRCTATNAVGQIKLSVTVTHSPLYSDGKISPLGTHEVTTPEMTSEKPTKFHPGAFILIASVVLLFLVAFITNTLYVVDREKHTGRARITSVTPITTDPTPDAVTIFMVRPFDSLHR